MIGKKENLKKKTQVGQKRWSETENHKKERLATLKRLKRGDDNELERNLRLQKVIANKQLRLAVETEEERSARLENDAATKRRDGRRKKTRLEKMIATAQLMLALIKGVDDVGVVFVPQTHSEKLATMLIIQT